MKIIKSASLDAIDAICIDVESTFTRCITIYSIIKYNYLLISFISNFVSYTLTIIYYNFLQINI
jgi:hypothetical protein